MGAVLLAGGAKGKRSALKNARVMIHQASSGFRGTAADINVQVAETNLVNNTILGILADHTGKDAEQVKRDVDRDNYMSSEEAMNYGLIDRVVEPGAR
jgi:ATP-dependent Clp protease protease subunit